MNVRSRVAPIRSILVLGYGVIQTVANSLKSEPRAENHIARIGGKECTILTSGTDDAMVNVLATRIKKLVAAHVFKTMLGNFRMTISGGAAFIQEDSSEQGLHKRTDGSGKLQSSVF